MTTPQENRVKAGGKLGSQLEFFTVKTSLDIAPGMKTPAEIAAEVAARVPTPVAGADFTDLVKETPSQTRLDYFVATINEFAQPVVMNFMPAATADTNGDTHGIMFAFEHVGCAARGGKTAIVNIAAALAAAIVVNGDAADVAAALAMITVTAQ